MRTEKIFKLSKEKEFEYYGNKLKEIKEYGENRLRQSYVKGIKLNYKRAKKNLRK